MQPRDATTDPPQAAAGMDPHLRELLRWLDQLLAWQVVVSQQQFGAIADDVHRGLYISDDEALLLSSGPYDVPPALVEARAALAAERERIDAGAVGPSPLRRLADLFGLSPLECDVILLTLVPEIALHYERLYGYIQDDVTRKRPTVQLALRLLCLGEDEALAARAVFAPRRRCCTSGSFTCTRTASATRRCWPTSSSSTRASSTSCSAQARSTP